MNHWLETSKRNLIPLSQASSFREALSEWSFTGIVIDYDHEEIECELCEHPDLAHHFEIQNATNSNRLLVGSSCILKFSEINIRDDTGRSITDHDERQHHLEDALKKKLVETMLEPLRTLWLKDKAYRQEIERSAKRLKAGNGVAPGDLLLLFQRMEWHKIPYSAKRYKLTLRSQFDQWDMSKIPTKELIKIKLALSSAQLKKHAQLFN